MSACYVKKIIHLDTYPLVQNLIDPLLEYPIGSRIPIGTLNPFVRILEVLNSPSSIYTYLLDYGFSEKPGLSYAEYSRLLPTDLQKIETIRGSIPSPIIKFLNSHCSFIGFDLLGNWFIEIIIAEGGHSEHYSTPSFPRIRELLKWMTLNISKMEGDLSDISKALKKAGGKPKLNSRSRSNVKYKSAGKSPKPRKE